MEVATIQIDREEARKRVEEFTAKRRKKLTEMDQALFRGYKALAEGLTLIDVNEAVRQGGYFEENYCPKLAIARSDVETVYFNHRFDWSDTPPKHGGNYIAWNPNNRDAAEKIRHDAIEALARDGERSFFDVARDKGFVIELVHGSIESPEDERKQSRRWFKSTYSTTVPAIPFHLRPNGDAEKYFILWEVDEWKEWQQTRAPGDPLLLERIAHPIYVVVAQWDLSELEKRILESFRRR